MILCRVLGDVVASHMNQHLRNNRLLIVEPIDLSGARAGVEMLALDRVDAGAGDTVLVLKEGGGARILFQNDKIPLQTVVVAVVDRLAVEPWAEAELAGGKP